MPTVMKRKSILLLFLSIMLVVTLSACQSGNRNTAQKPNNAESAQNNNDNLGKNDKLPENLPADFPLPKDAQINTSNSDTVDGKKSALLIFTTKENISEVTKMYTDYFKKKNLGDSAQTIDEKNIIIQGDNEDKSESWSLIGGAISSSEGVIEITVTWSEL